MQGIYPVRFDGQGLLMKAIMATSPATFSDASPVGGGVAAAPEALLFNEGLHQDQVLLVDPLPVGAQATHASTQHEGSYVRHLRPRQEHKPVVIHHPGQTRLALKDGPANKLVPRRHLKGRRAETQASDGSLPLPDQVFDLRPFGLLIAQVVIGAEESLE